jgi:hypothetical protein
MRRLDLSRGGFIEEEEEEGRRRTRFPDALAILPTERQA